MRGTESSSLHKWSQWNVEIPEIKPWFRLGVFNIGTSIKSSVILYQHVSHTAILGVFPIFRLTKLLVPSFSEESLQVRIARALASLLRSAEGGRWDAWRDHRV